MELLRLLKMATRFPRHPRIFLLGAREYRSAFGMTYDHPYTSKSVAYDSGREAAHIVTLRKYDSE